MPRSKIASNVIVAIVIVLSLSAVAGTMLSFSPASAQQPTSGPTRAVQVWCPDVPQSPAPPSEDPNTWAQAYKGCTTLHSAWPLRKQRTEWRLCRNLCGKAKADWYFSKHPVPMNPNYFSTTEPQGPFPLPGGGSLNILPLPSVGTTPAATQTPSAG